MIEECPDCNEYLIECPHCGEEYCPFCLQTKEKLILDMRERGDL